MDNKTVLTVSELQNALNISRATAYQLCNSKKFPAAFRVGRKILINSLKLQEWIEQGGTACENE